MRGLRAAGVEFMPTPAPTTTCCRRASSAWASARSTRTSTTLRELEILVDGEGPKQYLLQIFLKEAAGLYHDPQAGPFFFEIIQRKGSNGFGAGNFRALFESIERQQRRTSRIS